jgi:hypothetical protein
MYYVFFETGNDAFFSGITDAFCSIVVQSVIDAYKEFYEHRKDWRPLHCTLFPAVYCGDRGCANNKIFLTTDQIDRFEVSMTKTQYALLGSKKYLEDVAVRLDIQRILQNYRIMTIHGVEHIPVRDRQDHNKYLRSYIKETNKLKDKAEGFVYARAKTNSDYDYFRANTKLPNVTACDHYQQA